MVDELMDSALVSVKNAAKLIGVSENTVRKLFDEGKLGGYRTPGGHRRIYHQDVAELSKSLTNNKWIVIPSR